MPQTSKRVKSESLPELTVTLQDDSNLNLKTVKNAVFFFFPKANTPGCSKQAHDYKEHHAEFTGKGFKVYGVSKDTCKALSGWKSKESFQYHFISDKDGQLSKHFGLNKGASVVRGHVVVKDGKVLDIVSGVKPLESVTKALAIIANPHGEQEDDDVDDEDDNEEADEPARKEPKAVDVKKSPAATPAKVAPVSSPKKVGKESPIVAKPKEEIIHDKTHDKEQEALKSKVQKELKQSQTERQHDKKIKEHTKELKKEVLAEIKK